MLSHTIGFETTQSWTASVRETSRAESWISINPTSGDAGKHTITVTLTENETTESRQAVVIISCGGESANISITQRGVGQDEPEDPDNPNNPDNPQKPEHPDVAPEDRLTWVETTYTEVYSDGSSTDKSYMLFEYDAEGLLTGYDQYDYDSEQTDKINASYEGTLKRSEGKITDEEKWFEIGGLRRNAPSQLGRIHQGIPPECKRSGKRLHRPGRRQPDFHLQRRRHAGSFGIPRSFLSRSEFYRDAYLAGRQHRFHFDHRRTG